MSHIPDSLCSCGWVFYKMDVFSPQIKPSGASCPMCPEFCKFDFLKAIPYVGTSGVLVYPAPHHCVPLAEYRGG
jgi:hypothetical protein